MFIIPKDATDTEVAAMFGQAVQKHAEHDQKDHGNWADGSILERGSYRDPMKEYTTGHQLVAVPYGKADPVASLQYDLDWRGEEPVLTITALWVKPSYRRQGVATAMLKKLKEKHRREKISTDQKFTREGEAFWRAVVGDPGEVKRTKLPTPKLKDAT